MDFAKVLAQELFILPEQVQAVIQLLEEGNTIPFIARYRKELHGGLNDEVLRKLEERLNYLKNLEDRKQQILVTIENQGALTPVLKSQITEAMTLVVLEDIYRPYKPKRRTRAMIAKEKGLEPLALLLKEQRIKKSVLDVAKAYVNEAQDVCNAEAALHGAMDILAEQISDHAQYRSYIRGVCEKQGILQVEAKDDTQASPYEIYYHFEEPVAKIATHRILAINRGEEEKVLTVRVAVPRDQILRYLERQEITRNNIYTNAVLQEVVADSYDRLIAPSIEREIRNGLTERAEEASLVVFGKNLNQLLMQPPIAGQIVLGWDPAFRTGCKLAVVDETGKVLDTKVIYPTDSPKKDIPKAKEVVKKLIETYHITLISLGNGTASRESEQVIVEILKEIKKPVFYMITNEAGASVYSASKLATEEFPDFDVAQRSAVSIARRVQDPLAELVKIEPKAIGVGQYQHDMNQKRLGETLHGVVEDCVNQVGVDLNTASVSLLEYIAGINKTVARNIVTYREENGRFSNRKQLLKVPKLGPKAYEQCAGFLRITGGDNPLDTTAVHPESYKVTEALLQQLGYKVTDILNGGVKGIKNRISTLQMSKNLGVGELTLIDIIKELEKPSRDPREDMPKPILRQDILQMEDLKPGMILSGTVRNIIDFGIFVDIGVHQDGLVHISQICDRYIKHPLEVVRLGDVVQVQVMSVDLKKKRISLTMRIAQQ